MASSGPELERQAVASDQAASMLWRLVVSAAGVIAVAWLAGLLLGEPIAADRSQPAARLIAGTLRGGEFLLAGTPLLVLVRLAIGLRREDPRLARLALGALVATVLGVVMAA